VISIFLLIVTASGLVDAPVSLGSTSDRSSPDCIPPGVTTIASDASGAIYSTGGGKTSVRYFGCTAGSTSRIELKPPKLPGYSGRGTIGLARLRQTHFALSWSSLSKDSAQSRIVFGNLRMPSRVRTVLAVQSPSESSGRSTLVLALRLSADGRPAWIGEQLGFFSEHSDAVRQVDAVSSGGAIVVLDEGASVGSHLLAWNGRRVRWTGASATRSAIVP
jgi:hypothetical protein